MTQVLSLFRGLIEIPETRTMREILADVAQRYEVSPDLIRGPSRHRIHVRPRWEAMYLIRQVRTRNGAHRYSLPMIGAFFGRDHASVLHAVREYEARLIEGLELAA